MTGPAPILEPRSAEALAAALHARIGGYLPGWQPAPGGPGDGLLAISGTLLRALAERLNAAPEKNRLAFLDLLGLELLPAQAARAPVVFTVAPGAAGAVPAGTRLGATRPGGGDPIAFATEARVMVSPRGWPRSRRCGRAATSGRTTAPTRPAAGRSRPSLGSCGCRTSCTCRASASSRWPASRPSISRCGSARRDPSRSSSPGSTGTARRGGRSTVTTGRSASLAPERSG